MIPKLFPVWTAVDVPTLIHCTLEWHMENQSALQLMVDFRTDALPAHLIAMDEKHLLVHCKGMPRIGNATRASYTLLGKNAGGNVLLNGAIRRISHSGDVFTLGIPPRIDVGMPDEYLAVADGLMATAVEAIARRSPVRAKKCRASHRIMGNGLCIRRGPLHWFSHLRRIV